MCGIVGLIHKGRNKYENIGDQMTSMLQSLKHRGPDSTGYALYGGDKGTHVIRLKVAESVDLETGFDIHQIIKQRVKTVNKRLRSMVELINHDQVTPYAYRYEFNFTGNMRLLADFLEYIEGVEILSIGSSLELIKDLGDAEKVCAQYKLATFKGTHGIGHTRMATESDVDIRSAHPYWAYPFSDISVVHNGQLTNYWTNRRVLEKKGHRFASNCDSELIAVYLADQLNSGIDLEAAMKQSIEYFDGVFTYLVATKNQLGMAKDVMAAKPLVLYESDDIIAMASEEVAIRTLFSHHIDTHDPYHSEVKVWHN